jgi:hypothetical protein
LGLLGAFFIFNGTSDSYQPNLTVAELESRQTSVNIGTGLTLSALSIQSPIVEALSNVYDCATGYCDPSLMIPGPASPYREALEDGVTTMPARDIRWTQDTATWSTGNGVPLDTLADDMLENGWKGDPLRLIEYEGKLYSYDNRRLAAAKLADIDVPVTILDPWDGWMRHFSTNNFGESVEVVTKRIARGGEYLDITIFKNGTIEMS